MKFEKWQALGNDYLILERDELPFELTAGARAPALRGALRRVRRRRAAALAPGRSGARGRPADLQPRRLGGRAVGQRRARGDPVPAPARLDRARQLLDPHARRRRSARRSPGRYSCRVDMGRASRHVQGLPRRPAGRASASSLPRPAQWRFQHVSIGNPQCAIRVADAAALAALDLAALGPPIEAHALFPTARTSPGTPSSAAGPPARIRARIFERGVGETLSSGTGATGAAVAYVLDARAGRSPDVPAGPARVVVVLDGGELEVEVDAGSARPPDRLGAAGVRGPAQRGLRQSCARSREALRVEDARTETKEPHETE